MPRRKQAVTQDRSKVIRETENNPFTEEEAAGSRRAGPSSAVSTPVTGRIESFSSFGSSKDKRKKDKAKHGKSGSRSFNLAAEQDQMKSTIAESSIAATNLMNALQTVNREIERVSHNATAVKHFEACKQLRRKILRYVSRTSSWAGRVNFGPRPPPINSAEISLLTILSVDTLCRVGRLARWLASRQRRAYYCFDDL